jgi:hypothetical protein
MDGLKASFAVRSDDVATLRASFETMRMWNVAKRLDSAMRSLRYGMTFQAGQDLAAARQQAMDLEGEAKTRALQLAGWVHDIGFKAEVAVCVRTSDAVREVLAGKAA